MIVSWAEQLLAKFKPLEPPTEVEPGCWTNWLGLKTSVESFPAVAHLAGTVIARIPVPGDGVYGSAMEYCGLLSAIERRGTDRGTYNAVELGAGWGPWISASGVVAKRVGFKEVNLVGVEAAHEKIRLMHEHLERNKLSAKVIHGAAWRENTTLTFPCDRPINDHGMGVANGLVDKDYRGFDVTSVDVSAYDLPTICKGMAIVDYIASDIQGAEHETFSAAIDFLNTSVRHVFIGTHSRLIEGKLMELFYDAGWDLLWEKPCRMKFDRTRPTLLGMVSRDGEQFWRNPRLT